MERFVLRVDLPDRPGALGLVASRVGAVRGEIVGIDILDRDGGRAVDELVVELPDRSLLGLLVDEVTAVDGVDVEELRSAEPSRADPLLDALETAVGLAEAASVTSLVDTLVASAHRSFEADAATVEEEAPACGGDDVVRVPLPAAGRALVLRRAGRRFRSRELARLRALARIADLRWDALSGAAPAEGHHRAGFGTGGPLSEEAGVARSTPGS